MSVSPDELERRKPLWDAMGDLFLDTEVRWYLPYVARVCVESRFDDATLEDIFWCEVFPLGADNLDQLIGEWAVLGVPESSFIRRAGSKERKTMTELRLGWMVTQKWAGALALSRVLRTEPQPRWLPLSAAWNLLCRRYFEEPGDRMLSDPAPQLERAKADGIDVAAEWTRLEPLLQAVLYDDEPHAPRAAMVRSLVSL